MLNLPGDTLEDVIEGAKVLSVVGSDFVKLHALYIVEGTVMAQQYKKGEIEICSLNEYKQRVIEFLRHINPNMAVERIIGRAPEKYTLFSNWNTSWWKIRDDIEKEMQDNGFYQGDKFDYIGGKALRILNN